MIDTDRIRLSGRERARDDHEIADNIIITHKYRNRDDIYYILRRVSYRRSVKSPKTTRFKVSDPSRDGHGRGGGVKSHIIILLYGQ